MTRIVGIDLGTSTSEIAHFQHGRPWVLVNDQERPITPSALWAKPSGELIAGESAYEQWESVSKYKLKMGRDLRLSLGEHNLSPEECSALLLKYLLRCAEEQLQEEIDRAVITVPANWKEAPRRATQEAGRLAGIEVERLINEPTAAAMAFGLRPDADGKTIAVYDLGGGTFDVTILKIHNRIFDVITSLGDSCLGGENIDELLVQHAIRQTSETTGYTHRLGEDKQTDHNLRLACELAKKELSDLEEVRIGLASFGLHGETPIDLDVPVTRAQLDRMIEPLVQRSIDYMKEALRQAKLTAGDVDEVVMVGGSSRIPLVRQRVAELMGREPNTSDVNPDEAVALGAAIQAGIVDQQEVYEDSYLALDVVNHHLGVETLVMVNDQPVPGRFAVIIEKGNKVPTTKTREFTTVVENQQQIEVKCFQGNHPVAAQNDLVGAPILVEGLPRRPAGQVKILITFSLSASEMLDVGVRIEDTELAVMRSFTLSRDRFSDEERAGRQEILDAVWRRSDLAGKYRILIERAEEALGSDSLDDSNRASLESALTRLKESIAGGQEEQTELADLALSEMLFELE